MAASKYTKSKSTKKSAERGAKTNVSSAVKNRKVGFWKSWMALPIIAIVAVTGYGIVQYSQASSWINGAWYGSVAHSYNGIPYSGSGYGPGADAGQTITAKIITGDKILNQNGTKYTTNERICVFFKSNEGGGRGMWNFLEGAGEVQVTQNNDPSSIISVSNGDFKGGAENTISGCMPVKELEMEDYGNLGPVKRGNSFRLFATEAYAATEGKPQFTRECVNKQCQTVPALRQPATTTPDKSNGTAKDSTTGETAGSSSTSETEDPPPASTTPPINTSANPSQPTGDRNEHTIRIKVLKGSIGQVFVYTGAW